MKENKENWRFFDDQWNGQEEENRDGEVLNRGTGTASTPPDDTEGSR